MGDASAPEPIGAVRAAVSAASEIIQAAKENDDAIAAGQTAAKTLNVLSTSLYNMLMPLRVLNFAAAKVEDYFSQRFGTELGEKLASVPAEDIVEPKTFIAGPVLQGVADTVDEPDLRALYVHLLARAMDARSADAAHPSFAEIIKQLSPAEATGIKSVILMPHSAVVTIQGRLNRGYVIYERNVLPIFEFPHGYTPELAVQAAQWVDNWSRLGLVEVDYQELLIDDNSYEWVKTRPEYLYRTSHMPDGQTINTKNGVLRRTDFGTAFAHAVGLLDPPS